MNHLRLDTSQSDRVTIWIDVCGRSLNVLSEPVFDELCQCLDQAVHPSVGRPVVLRSAKGKAFVVGADLRRILAIESEAQLQQFLLYGQEALQRLEQFPGETVAFIRGPCLGGGLELALACRYRVACDSAETHLGMPEAKLGLMPGWGGTVRLIETVGLPAGMHMLLAGEGVDAQEAVKIGLVDAIAAETDCEATLSDFLRSLRQEPAAAGCHRRRSGTSVSPPSPSVSPPSPSQLDAWVRAQASPFSPAQQAILRAATAGIEQSRAAGFRAERELFFPLLMSPQVREKLQRYAGPGSPGGGQP